MRSSVTHAAGVISAALALGIATTSADELTIVSWGGVYTESQQRAYGETWERKTGKTIRWVDYNGGLGEIRAQIEAGEVLWDIVDVFAHEARVGCDEGLFERLPRDRFVPGPDGTPMDDELLVPLPNDCVVPNIVWSWVVFYDENRLFGDRPRTLEDFFDLERFPGRRGISAFPQVNIEMALVADGVEPERVYEVMNTPEGIDRAFAKLNMIRDAVVFWSSGVEPLELVGNGRVVMSTAYNGRVGAAVLDEGASFETLPHGQVLDEEWFVMVKGTGNYQDALDFLIHASAPEQQAAQARWIPYGPMRRSALAIIAENEPWHHGGADVMPHLPNRADIRASTILADADWWAVNGDEITQRFTDWMAQ